MAIGPQSIIESNKKLRAAEAMIDSLLLARCGDFSEATSEKTVKIEVTHILTDIERTALCEKYKAAGWSQASTIPYPDSSTIGFAIILEYKK